MNNMDIKNTTYKLLATDFNCTVDELKSPDNIFIERSTHSLNRYFAGESQFLRVLCIKNKLVFNVDKAIMPWCRKTFSKYPGQWFFNFQTLKTVETILNKHSYQIHPHSHHNYIPLSCPDDIAIPNIRLEIFEGDALLFNTIN